MSDSRSREKNIRVEIKNKKKNKKAMVIEDARYTQHLG